MGKERSRKCLLQLEVLEDRCLLSASVPPADVLSVNPAAASTSDILVQFRSQPSTSYLGLSLLPGTTVSQQLDLVSGLYEVVLKQGVTVAQALAVYRADPRVLQATPDALFSAEQVASVPTPSSLLWGLQQIKAPQAWQITTGSSQVIVAVMDTGIDYDHPDLYDNIWINQAEIPASRLKNLVDVYHDGFISFRDLNSPINQGPGKITDVNGDGRIDAADLLAPMILNSSGQDTGQGGWADGSTQDGSTNNPDDLIGWNFVGNNDSPLDDNGHGTHVAGIIGASGADGSGVVGVDPNVTLMPVKWMDSAGSGTISAYLAGLQFAIAHGATIINNSWTSTDSQSFLSSAIQNAQAQGVIFVAAAGNSSTNNDTTPAYPATLGMSNIVAVAASDQNDNLASFSNFGSQGVDLAAPGVGIYSTWMGGGFAYDSGTSMATPYVTGVLALVRGLHPNWSYKQVINQVLNTVDPMGGLIGKVAMGGRLDAAAAVGWAPSLDLAGGFAGSAGLLTYNGSAASNGTKAELTNGKTSQAGSVFSTNPVNVTQFSTQFTFQLSAGSSTADGFTFTIQGKGPKALGQTGGSLGYAGITNSVAIKFDLYNNTGEGNDSTGLYLNGAVPASAGSINLTGTGIDLHSGDVFQANLGYDGTTLTVILTDTKTGKSATQHYTVNIPTQMGNNRAYVGFTGGTGGLTSTQDILNWTFLPSAPTVPAAPSGLTATPATTTSVSLTWANNATIQVGYHLDRATDPNFTQNLVTLTLPVTPTSYTDTTNGLTAGGTYYYRLRATNTAGESANSKVATVTLPLPPSSAGLSYSAGFTSTTGLKLNGSAKTSGTALELTDGGSTEAGSAFSATPMSVVGFTTSFDFQLNNANADGFAFVLQSDGATALGSYGGGLGYAGIVNSVAIKFDLYNNAGEGNNSTGLYLNGASLTNAGSINLTGTGLNLHSGDPFHAAMTYNGSVLQVTLKDQTTGATATQSYTVNIGTVLHGSAGYVGFTGGTGGLTAIQNILDWTYQATA